MKGIDLSNNNSAVEWDGVKFMFAKATESTGFIDSTLHKWVEQAEREGALYSCYHFAHPDKNSAKDEADFFLHNSLPGDFGAALDFESRDVGGQHYDPLQILGVKRSVEWANEFLDRVAQIRQKHPFFYSYRADMRAMVAGGLDGWNLWLSVMGGVPAFPTFAGRAVAIEQWGVVNGVDQNVSYVPLKEEEPGDDDMPPAAQFRHDKSGSIIIVPRNGAKPYVADNTGSLTVQMNAGAVDRAALPLDDKQYQDLLAQCNRQP